MGEKSKAKAKASDSYIAHLTGTKPDQLRFTIIEIAVDLSKSSGHVLPVKCLTLGQYCKVFDHCGNNKK